jgi:hypothetical protein
MRALIFFTARLAIILALSGAPSAVLARGDPCERLEKAAEFLDTQKLRSEYQARVQKGLGEPLVEMGSIEKARNYVQNLPAFKDFGFDVGDYTQWKKYSARLEKSAFKDKFTGWETKVGDNHARYRLDFEPDTIDPKTGAVVKEGLGLHYNIELRGKDSTGKVEKVKLAVKVLCEGKTCSQTQALKYVEKMN